MFVLSLGQLIQSDIRKTLDAFEALFRQKNVFFPQFRVRYALFRAKSSGLLDKLKQGDVTWPEFIRKVNGYSGVSLSEDEFTSCWNKMVEMKKEMIPVLQEVAHWQRHTPSELIIYSSTNEPHIAYIQKSFTDHKIFFDDRKTHFAMSCSPQYQQINPIKILRQVIFEHQLDQHEHTFVFLSDIFKNGKDLQLKRSGVITHLLRPQEETLAHLIERVTQSPEKNSYIVPNTAPDLPHIHEEFSYVARLEATKNKENVILGA